MATKLHKFDFTQPSAITTPGEKAIYPWDEWLDGDIWQLTEGEDFDTHPLMMERIIRTRATARRTKVRLRHQPLNGDSPFGVIILQRTDVKGPAELKKAEQANKRAAKTAAAKKEAEALVKAAGIKPVKKAAARNGNGANGNGAKHPKGTPSKKAAPKPAAVKTASKRVAKVGA